MTTPSKRLRKTFAAFKSAQSVLTASEDKELKALRKKYLGKEVTTSRDTPESRRELRESQKTFRAFGYGNDVPRQRVQTIKVGRRRGRVCIIFFVGVRALGAKRFEEFEIKLKGRK